MTNPPCEPGVCFVIGAPRSGTTWIGKIFDSHPAVLYLNEPDIALRDDALPVICKRSESAEYEELTRAYLDRLLANRTLRTSGALPVFQKEFRSRPAHALRAAIIYGLRLAQVTDLGTGWADRIPIPDFENGRGRMVVVKSVSARGRAGIFSQALPESRTVLVLRNPCGVIASLLRGIRLGKMPEPTQLDEVLETEEADRYGLQAASFRSLTLVQKLAWHWAILNEKALRDLAHKPATVIVRYEDAVANPLKFSRQLLAFVGLPWMAQTAQFATRSTTYRGPDRYFSVWRNSASRTNGWRNELSAEEQYQIAEITAKTLIGRLYAADLLPLANAPTLRPVGDTARSASQAKKAPCRRRGMATAPLIPIGSLNSLIGAIGGLGLGDW